jgi:hypothetical protein
MVIWMNKLLALLILGILMLGVFSGFYTAYAFNTPKHSITDDDGDDDSSKDGSDGSDDSDDSGDDGTKDSDSGSSDDEESEEAEEEDEFMEEYYDLLEEYNELMEKLDKLNEKGYNVSNLYSLLSDANSTLNMALDLYNSGDFSGAWVALKDAKIILEDVEHGIKQVVKSGNVVIEHHEEDEEDEDDDYIEYVVDSNITVSSPDNKIEFSGEKPKLEFYYYRNNTKIEFSVEEFVFIEFVDLNGNGMVDSDEILQKYSADDLQWQVNITETTFDNNTEITIVYYTNTSGFEIEIVMHIYRYGITQNSTVGDKTISINVDGGADQVKYDFIVYRWTWMSNESLLALFNEVEIEAYGSVSLVEAGVNEDMITVDLGPVDVMISWVKVAYADGSPLNVSAYYKSFEFEGESGKAEMELEVAFIYPYFGDAILVHDPSIGVLEAFAGISKALITTEMLMLLGILSIVIVGVAVLLSRKGYIASII